MTGWYRDGKCRTDAWDRGSHTVCAVMTSEFLEYTKSMGNDLSTPSCANMSNPRKLFKTQTLGFSWSSSRRPLVFVLTSVEASDERGQSSPGGIGGFPQKRSSSELH